MRMRLRIRLLVGLGAGMLSVGLVAGSLPASAAAKYDRTSAAERHRMDAVPTPKLGWYDCYGGYRCSTTRLPLDYDRPKGATTEVALLKFPARQPKNKIGTLFVNPGGPGGSATELAYFAPFVFDQEVLNRFDIVGVDPRGIGFSENLECFASQAKQAPVLNTLSSVVFPDTAKEEAAYEKAVVKLGVACASSGQPMASSMSTAEVTRDTDVLRRAVGDKKLSYFGFSYGTYLGQVYANLFPDRVRALALDGVIDPVGWQGKSKDAPVWDPIRSADGSSHALRTLLRLCDEAGGQKCRFAPGNPADNLAVIASRLKRSPLEETDPFTEETFHYGYPELSNDLVGALYQTDAPQIVTDLLADLIIVTEPPAKASAARSGPAAAEQNHQKAAARTNALRDLIRTVTVLERRATTPTIPKAATRSGQQPRRSVASGFPYDNGLETFADVQCTDSVPAGRTAQWSGYAAAADRRTPYVGPLWAWQSVFCAKDAWKAKDEDAYRGSFTHKTAAPLLFVGDYYDPATNYAGARKADSLAPNSRLLSSNSWGHTAYGTSECVSAGVDNYLVKLKLPKRGKVCQGTSSRSPATAVTPVARSRCSG